MREFGGYLPLELPQKDEFFSESEFDFLRLNCGRSAIYCALLDSQPKKVYIPLYNCETVCEPFERLKIPYSFYRIDKDFLPINVHLKSDEYLLYVNYYGIIPTSRLDYIHAQYQSVYFDNTQAFFAEPYKDTYNIYSCRKFFGVSDGAYLIKNGIRNIDLPQDSSFERILFATKAIEYGTNEAYPMHLENELKLANDVRMMSRLTQRILQSIEYDDIKKRRKENFLALHDLLGNNNELIVNDSIDTPIAYPFLVGREGMRRKLVDKKIYIPCWWQHVLNKTNEGDFENYSSRYLLPLPIDQRYGVADMRILAQTINEIMGA